MIPLMQVTHSKTAANLWGTFHVVLPWRAACPQRSRALCRGFGGWRSEGWGAQPEAQVMLPSFPPSDYLLQSSSPPTSSLTASPLASLADPLRALLHTAARIPMLETSSNYT